MFIKDAQSSQVYKLHCSEKPAFTRGRSFVPAANLNRAQYDTTDTGVKRVYSPSEYSPTLFMNTRNRAQIDAAMQLAQLNNTDISLHSYMSG